MLEKLVNLFTKKEIPDEIKRVFSKAKNTKELLSALDNLQSNNQIYISDVNKEIAQLEDY